MSELKNDDLAAVRIIADSLKHFDNTDRERIIRWAKEKLNMPTESPSFPRSEAASSPITTSTTVGSSTGLVHTVKSFYQEKNPKSDIQFATVIAYFYKFEAPENERKETIGATDLLDACRLAGRVRLSDPLKTLSNAYGSGYFDRGERGQFRLSTVGENLVAMVLPSNESKASVISKRKTKSPSPKRRTGK